MKLMSKLRQDQLHARKVKDSDTASLLTTLIGEAAMIGKNDGSRETTDAEVIAVIKKFIKNINETLDVRADDLHLLKERAILESYLPQQISGDRLENTIQGIIMSVGAESMRDMGKVMKTLKENYDGQFDGQEASGIVKELLK